MPQTKCNFTLNVISENILPQQAIFLSGSAQQMGHWDLSKAIKLVPIDTFGRLWQVAIEVNSDSILEYKFVLMGLALQAKWESLPANRLLNTNGKKEVRLIEIWGDVQVSEDWVPFIKNKVPSSEESLHSEHTPTLYKDPLFGENKNNISAISHSTSHPAANQPHNRF